MIKMARLTEYAFMVLLTLKKSSRPISADALSNQIGLETPTVSKILKLLKKSGLLSSKRGAVGGYVLLKNRRDISLHEVISAMEGEIALTDCVEDNNACHLSDACSMSNGLKKVSLVIAKALKDISILELKDESKTVELQIKS